MNTYLADLHIHSRFSMATSRDIDPPRLDWWARRKGLGLIGTGDCLHPGWLKELEECLVPAGEGVYRLREELALPEAPEGEEKQLTARVWRGPLSMELSEMIAEAAFPVTEEGLSQTIAWLEERAAELNGKTPIR